MANFPDDIFTEPSDVDPDTLANLGPLRRLAGEPATGLVLQTVAIPRGQVAIASGQASPDDDRLVLTAERGQTEYGICSTAFLEYAFRTDRYRIELTFNPDSTFSYVIDTTLMVRGETEPFNHRDVNTLTKVADAKPNPWAEIVQQQGS